MKSTYLKRVTAMILLAGALTLAACGGGSSDSKSSDSEATSAESSQNPGGGMFANLSDEDIQCLEDEGVSLPSAPPEGMPEGTTPPEGAPEGGPPEGMPEGMEGLQDAMSACGIEQPAPPSEDDSR